MGRRRGDGEGGASGRSRWLANGTPGHRGANGRRHRADLRRPPLPSTPEKEGGGFAEEGVRRERGLAQLAETDAVRARRERR